MVHVDVPGGSALYAAAAAARHGPVRMLGTIGTDFPQALLDQLAGRGIDSAAVERLEGPTFRWQARYDATGGHRETLARDRGVAEGRLPPLPPPPSGPHALLLGSTSPLVQAHVRHGHPEALLVGLDSMAHWWTTHAEGLRRLLPMVHVVYVDREELALATAIVDEGPAVARLHAAGPEVVVVKHGAAGASLYRRGCPPLPMDAVAPAAIVDTTGAGDAFAGALLASLLRGDPDVEALGCAVAMASRAIGGVGISGMY